MTPPSRMPIEERLAALEAQVAELTRLVAEQRSELDARKIWHSMARTLTCPACGGGSIVVVKQVKEFAHMEFVPLSLNPRMSMWKGLVPGDPLHVYVCKDCRLVEWHVDSVEHLAPDGVTIIELTRPDDDEDVPSDDPYR
jgi:hypothetical protein